MIISKLIPIFIALMTSPALYAQFNCYDVDLNSSFSAAASRQEQILSHETSVRRSGFSPAPFCRDYEIYFGTGSANSYQRRAFSGNNSIPYNIYADASKGSVLKDFPDATAGEFLSGRASSRNRSYTEIFYISVPEITSIFSQPPGVYTDVIPINYYARSMFGTADFQTTRFLTIQIQIPRFVELSLVPENAPHDPNSTTYLMDFGAMNTNDEMGADLRVVGNVGFGVMMSSTNGSKLVNNNSSVDYQVKVGSGGYQSLAPAGSLYQMAQNSSGTSLNGKRFNLRVRLGQVDDSLESGTYEDVITITIQAW